jgi:hypothetical protein
MNLWAFRPAFIEDLVVNFEARLKKGIVEAPLKFEETLSDAVQNILDRNAGSVKIVRTDAEWFGMTYREDVEQVKKELDNLTAEGVYPEGEW